MLRAIFPLLMPIDTPYNALKDPRINVSLPDDRQPAGAARGLDLRSIASQPPIAQVDDRQGRSDAQVGTGQVPPQWESWFKNVPVTEQPATLRAALDASKRLEEAEASAVLEQPLPPCGGIASSGTSEDNAELLKYFVTKAGSW